MDKGPFRGARSEGVRTKVAPRAAVAVKPPEPARSVERSVEPRPISPAPRPEKRTQKPTATERRNKLTADKPRRHGVWKVLAYLLFMAVLVGGLAWFIFESRHDVGDAIDETKYQAVFLTSGQVYFGKLHTFNRESMRITEVFYLRNQKPADEKDEGAIQQTSSAQRDVELVKLGDEVHSPMDEMVILKSQILFYENIEEEGSVARTIEQYKASRQ